MSTEISATTKITLVVGKHTIELSQADAKKLLAKLQELVGEKEAQVVVARDRIVERQIPQWFPPVICQEPQPATPSWRDGTVTCLSNRSWCIE